MRGEIASARVVPTTMPPQQEANGGQQELDEQPAKVVLTPGGRSMTEKSSDRWKA